MEILNSLTTILPNIGEITGRISFTGGTPSLGSLTGEAISDQAQVTIADTATGVTAITVQNALASAQVMVVTGVVPTTPGMIWAASVGTYSGNAGTVSITILKDTRDVATDDNYTFTIRFY